MKEKTNKKSLPEQEVREVQTQLAKMKNLLSSLPISANMAKQFNERLLAISQEVKKLELQLNKLQTKQDTSLNQDAATELPNRLAYEEHIQDAYHRWQRGFGDLSLAMAYIDQLATILNKDRSAGEKILQEIAILFKSSIRVVDFLARYDKEEFIFIFEQTSATSTSMVLEHLRVLIEENEFLYHNKKIPLTVSFGFSTLRRDDSLESLFTRTSEAMHRAKDNGGNQIASF